MRQTMMTAASENLGKPPKMGNGRHPTGTGYVYLRNGVKHREKGPAEIGHNGYEAWYQHGIKHRVGGPAVTYPDGRTEYWEKGQLIRSSGPNGPAPGTKVNMRSMSLKQRQQVVKP